MKAKLLFPRLCLLAGELAAVEIRGVKRISVNDAFEFSLWKNVNLSLLLLIAIGVTFDLADLKHLALSANLKPSR